MEGHALRRLEDLGDEARLLEAAARYGVEKPDRFRGRKGKLLAELFEAVGEERLVQQVITIPDTPTFHYLTEVSAALAANRIVCVAGASPRTWASTAPT